MIADSDDDDRNEDAAETDNVDEQQPMQMDLSAGVNKTSIDPYIVKEILRIFDSKQLTDKIEATLNELIAHHQQFEAVLRHVCLSVSYICNFVLLNSTVKIHKTL